MNLLQMKEGLSSTADHAKSRFRVKNRKRKDFSTFRNKKKHSEYEIAWCIQKSLSDMKNIAGG